MKNYLKQKLILLGTFIVFYYVIEIIAFSWIEFQFLPGNLMIDIIFVLFIGLFVLIIPSNKWGIAYISFWLLFVNALFVTNANTFSGYFELFSLEQFKLLGEATDILNLDYISIRAFIDFLLIIVAYIISIRFLYKKFLKVKAPLDKKIALNVTGIFLVSMLFLVTIFSTRSFEPFEYYNEDVTLPTLKRHSLEKYGFLAYYYKEAELLYFKGESLPGYILEQEEPIKSDFNGLLAGYNVFTIMIESGEAYAVHPLLTPNLYKMTSQGIHLSNSYGENKTNVSEIIGINGHYPPQSFDTGNYDYQFENSIPLILSDRYESAFFHDNYSIFYSRGEILDMLGFDHLYFHDDIFPDQPRWQWDGNLTLDSVTANKMTDLMFKTDKPFYYFWTTLLTHGPYNEGEKNLQLFKDLGYYDLIQFAEDSGLWENPLIEYSQEDQERMLYYQAAMMDVDKSIGILMDTLEDMGKLDETLFVVYADHSAYYHNFNRKIASTQGDDASYYEIEIYKGFYTIYNERLTNAYINKGNTSGNISKFMSPYTIVPTVLDLLGEDYNQKLMLGQHVFSDIEHVFYSNKLTTFFTDNLYSDNGYDIVYQKDYVGESYLEEFRYQSQVIIEKLQAINEYYVHTRKEKEK